MSSFWKYSHFIVIILLIKENDDSIHKLVSLFPLLVSQCFIVERGLSHPRLGLFIGTFSQKYFDMLSFLSKHLTGIYGS